MTRFCGCRLADRTELMDILVDKGLIVSIEPVMNHPDLDSCFAAQGRLVTPGLIDVHTQGAGGAEVLSASPDAMAQMARTLARQGTTGFLATTAVQRNTDNRHLARAAQFTRSGCADAAICHGIHLEGPYINIVRKGGISVDHIFPATVKSIGEILDLCEYSLAMMTIAPEMPGNLAIVEQLVKHNVIAALGHTDATFEQASSGIDAGISHVTHLFNAMSGLHHRNPGALAAALNHERITAQIISDGVHVHGQMVKLAHRLLGDSRCILITDAMQAAGMPDGCYQYDGKAYETKNGTARYLDGTLIGSTLSMMQIALRFKSFTGCALQTALDCASLYPARVLGLDERKGSISVGKDADLVVWNDDFSVQATMIGGRFI